MPDGGSWTKQITQIICDQVVSLLDMNTYEYCTQVGGLLSLPTNVRLGWKCQAVAVDLYIKRKSICDQALSLLDTNTYVCTTHLLKEEASCPYPQCETRLKMPEVAVDLDK
jgi:hypothetical protein